MTTSNVDDRTLRNMTVDHAKRENLMSFLKENIKWVIGILVLGIALIVWFVFRPTSSEEGKTANSAAPAASASATQKNGKKPITEPNQLNLGNNPTTETPKPAVVQESGVPAKQSAQAPASQPAASAVAQASSASAPAKAVASQKAEQPAKVAKAGPRKKETIITEYREPPPAHKAAMGNAGFMKVASVAPTYYSSEEQCEAAWRAGRAVEYFPTMKSKSYGPSRIAGLSLRGGEAPACADMDTAAGRHWVFFPQGKEFYTQGAEVKFLAECQNTIHRIVFLKKEEPIAVLPPVPPAPQAPAPCGDCNKTVVEEVTKITRVNEFCEVRGQRFPMVNGQCNVPPVQVTTQGPTVTTPCCTQPVPQAPVAIPLPSVQPQGCPGGNCTPPRRTEAGGNGICRIKAGTDRVPECNFLWKVLRTQDDVQNCGCQILIPNPRRIVGFPDAMPGSPRCLEQKKLWSEIQGLRYSDARFGN